MYFIAKRRDVWIAFNIVAKNFTRALTRDNTCFGIACCVLFRSPVAPADYSETTTLLYQTARFYIVTETDLHSYNPKRKCKLKCR